MSPLKTISFEELRTRNESALNRVQYTPEVDVSTLTAYQRGRIQRLLSDRASLEDLASTQSQREAYGTEQWHESFVRLRDTTHYPDSTLEGDRLREHIWNAMPNSRFKRFQEAFCHPHQFIVPACNIDAKNTVTFVGNPEWNSMSLEPCLVSADRIPDELAADLHLVEFDESDTGNPYKRLQKKAQPEAIATLKKIWESAVPLQKRNHRLLSVQLPTDSVEARYAGTAGPDEAVVGSILYTREEENGRQNARNGNGKPRQLTVQHFDSVYGAHRKTLHETQSYGKEIEKLTALQGEVKALNGRLNRDWKQATPEAEKEAMRSEANTLILACRELLSACENKFKVQAHDLLGEIVDLKDKSDKTNVGASLAKMVAIINRLQSRFEEMYPKGGFNQQDHMVLETHIQQHEQTMRRFRDALQTNAGVVNDRLELFGSRDLSSKQTEGQSGGVLGRLRANPDDLRANIRLQPFLPYADKIRGKYEGLNSALRSRDLSASQDAIVQMHVIGKFQAVRTCFERVKEYIIDGENIPVSRIRDFVHRMNEVFSTLQIFPDHTVASYQDAFVHIRDELQRIEHGLAHYAGKDTDVGERTEMYGSLKKYIEQHNIEEILSTLP
ncbi:hypothetical protein COU78_02140 [Candidatus Peregrinibacteria bacterium CG10_big_fil_rev_8_21_14_0_10_49_24]|nr:MAG: hypothetical protein COV83_03740 [Candidatus Peregrinibacteria bacterium CG11_big_fil_rev_8_21_14_0_20_49_14]PIR51277.1 MAG: hypothetical protein COU78_02140 [Candidatus Peregrinibacteria bacterium CG10_big_fil_rev_8_21_14_0_10_49_24]PJA68085.1 MAG: hypothetical protein CO157_00905 [Candidatus Peregrinibacteria bacterium CG_4_9_14_3_um_filter_49_12]